MAWKVTEFNCIRPVGTLSVNAVRVNVVRSCGSWMPLNGCWVCHNRATPTVVSPCQWQLDRRRQVSARVSAAAVDHRAPAASAVSLISATTSFGFCHWPREAMSVPFHGVSRRGVHAPHPQNNDQWLWSESDYRNTEMVLAQQRTIRIKCSEKPSWLLQKTRSVSGLHPGLHWGAYSAPQTPSCWAGAGTLPTSALWASFPRYF